MDRNLSREVHDERDVEEAIGALSAADAERLLVVAQTWIEAFALDDVGRGSEDLMSEAVLRTLSGARQWRKGVGLAYHLAQTMRSIASSWVKSAVRRAAAGARPVRGSELRSPRDSEDFADALDELPADAPDFETWFVAADRVERLHRHFADDPRVRAVLAGWYEGKKGPEIQRQAGMTKKEFLAAVLRLRRFIRQRRASYVH